MGSITTIVSMLGVGLASGSLLLLGKASAFAGATTDVQLLGGSIVAFLVGILLFGWALGRRTQY